MFFDGQLFRPVGFLLCICFLNVELRAKEYGIYFLLLQRDGYVTKQRQHQKINKRIDAGRYSIITMPLPPPIINRIPPSPHDQKSPPTP